MSQFVLIGNSIVNIGSIVEIDFKDIEELRIAVYFNTGFVNVIGIQAIDLLMAIKPSAFESHRMKWHRHVWTFHNLIGHPVMQVLAFFKYYKAAMWVHDITVPRPIGARNFIKAKANG